MNAPNLNQSAIGDTSIIAATPAGVASDSITTVTRVATSVWRLDDRGGDTATTRPDTRFVSRLARRLVLTYTRRGEAIIDFDGDTAARRAAVATARTYVALTRRHRIAELDHLIRPASLTILRWPRPTVLATTASISDLLLACQLISATAPSLLAVVSIIEPGDISTSHSPDLGVLLAAATKARFTHEQRILALGVPAGDGDTYTYYPDDAGADAALHTWRDTTRPGVRVDILRRAARERHGG
jgi:hypothetical protein